MSSGTDALQGTPQAAGAMFAGRLGALVARCKSMDWLASGTFFVIGFSPITALAIAILGWLSLPVAAAAMILPSMVLGAALGVRFPHYGKLAMRGLGIGLVAVFVYDCVRFPFILLGIWGDFIPNIGMWLLNSSRPDWLVGYLYRYLGDGAGMGMAFVVSWSLVGPRSNCRPWATLYGIGIWLCLIATLLLAPDGEAMMFELTPTSFSLSLLGHIVYGAVIGELLTPGNRLARLVTAWTMFRRLRSAYDRRLPVGDHVARALLQVLERRALP